MTTVASWNVNGIRAASKKGFLDWLRAGDADIVCVQETKAHPDQLSEELLAPDGFKAHFASAERKGYSGVAIYTRREPNSVSTLGIERFDAEGRTLLAEYEHFTLVTGYFPNSQAAGARLQYKLDYCETILSVCSGLVDAGRNVVVCGDFNIAHRPIDLANPEANENNAGYLPEERDWMTHYLSAGYVDTFRQFTSDGGHYSWWSYRFKAREKDIGWRLDYHCVNEGFSEAVASSRIDSHVVGSDHCPVVLTLDV